MRDRVSVLFLFSLEYLTSPPSVVALGFGIHTAHRCRAIGLYHQSVLRGLVEVLAIAVWPQAACLVHRYLIGTVLALQRWWQNVVCVIGC